MMLQLALLLIQPTLRCSLGWIEIERIIKLYRQCCQHSEVLYVWFKRWMTSKRVCAFTYKPLQIKGQSFSKRCSFTIRRFRNVFWKPFKNSDTTFSNSWKAKCVFPWRDMGLLKLCLTVNIGATCPKGWTCNYRVPIHNANCYIIAVFLALTAVFTWTPGVCMIIVHSLILSRFW